ncbi:hypothetical protein [Microvirga thermotolerans]|uniref:Uncharacterized protein n=1 Tax=Microvirga thermotolerans TaxID=2651334 RepID=A0A5P9JV85_9HYPH|nr:hypothetical protein [Microvirga thermotolerans]QFU15360.1 hypothetical protein GDR74_03480 [Microvirga thermotolerans]
MRLRFTCPVILSLCLASCGYIPRPVEGVPPGAPWEALPLRKWLAEDRAEPIAMAFCAPPGCAPGLAVGVVRLTGRDADTAEAVLKDPSVLVRVLQAPSRKAASDRKRPVRTLAETVPLEEGALRGFAISLAPADGSKRPAYGAALGRRMGDELLAALVVGEDEASVRATLKEVAKRELGP